MVEKIKKSNPDLTPSYFEILVAASFLYFAQERVDWAVVEVGLGGRLDATNVLKPKLAVITNVGLDHTEILGTTLEKIANEKAGIIKSQKVTKITKEPKEPEEGIPVVTAASGRALRVIEKVAKSKKARLITLDTRSGENLLKSDTLPYLIIYKDIFRYIDKSFALENLLLAILAIKELGIQIESEVVERAISKQFEGRFEEIARGVILDGAHNPQKIKFLINFLRKFTVAGSQFTVILVVGFKRGKNWEKMVDLLIKNLPVTKVIVTQFQAPTDTGFFEAVDPEEIASYIKSTHQGLSLYGVYSNSQEAVFNALNTTQLPNYQTTQLILVTGSLYLVGEARTMWHLPSFDN